MHFFSPIFLTTFFFVSGYLFKEKCSFKQVLEQRTRTLLLPMLLLGGALIVLNQIITFNEPVPFMDRVKGLICQNGENQLLWFIAALYIYSLIFYWIERFSKTINGLILISLLLFVLNVVYSIWLGLPNIPWHLSSAGFGCFYMGLGKVYRHYEAKIDALMSKSAICLLLVIYIAILCFYNVSISFGGSKYMIDALIITLLGLLVCVYLSKIILNHNRFLLFVGANTLFYFAFHGKVYSLLQTITEKLFIISDIEHTLMLDFCLGIFITFLDALILIPLALFVNKYIPQVLGKGFKLWK